MTVQVASSFPLHAGASSKAFLAWLPQSDIDDYIAQSDLEAVTSSTIVTESALRTELAQIRNQGFAVSLGERQEGAGSIAAPLVDHTNMPVAVISVCGPLERFSSTMHASAVHLVAATTEISRRLGAPAI